MRKTWMTVASVVVAMTAAACDDGAATNDDATEATQASLSAGAAEGDGQALGSLAFPLSADAPRALPTAADRVAHLRAFIQNRLTCAEATPATSGDGLTVTFSKDCTWAGRRWTGTVTFTWAQGGDVADVAFDGVSVSGATLTGDMTVTRVAEGHVTVTADWTRQNAVRTVEGSWDADLQWTETTYTVNSATHTVKVNGLTATRTSTAVVWQKGEVSPESGTVTFSGFHGKTWTMVFGRDDGGNLTVTVTGPRGTRTFTIGAGEAVAES